MSLNDFESHSPEVSTECKELARKLLEPILELSPKIINWTKIQQCKKGPNESLWTITGNWGKFTFKQYSGIET